MTLALSDCFGEGAELDVDQQILKIYPANFSGGENGLTFWPTATPSQILTAYLLWLRNHLISLDAAIDPTAGVAPNLASLNREFRQRGTVNQVAFPLNFWCFVPDPSATINPNLIV